MLLSPEVPVDAFKPPPQGLMDQQIWQWTLTKEAIAPCFVRDVLDMRQNKDRAVDFFWLGHTPCRTVLVFGMVVGIQVYDKRAIYTIDDGTAVIDCVLRHPRPTLATKLVSPKKTLLDTVKPRTLESAEPPPPITEPGYPVRVVGKVARHYESKQIHADTIDPCPSSFDEITHFERVIELHKTKYSLAIPFVPPANSTSRAPPLVTPTVTDADASVFSGTSLAKHPGPGSSYNLPAPPPAPLPLQNRNRPLSIPTRAHPTYQHSHVPSSPTASSIASSTPSSPCKPSSPIKAYEPPQNPKLRHPSRLHTRDLTANTFRLYVKHYMDNAPPPFLISCPSPSRSICGGPTTPMKSARDEGDEPTPRPRARPELGETWIAGHNEDEDASRLGFTISHLRRVPELALLAARVVRSETRRINKADREKGRGNSLITSSISLSLPRPNRSGEVNRSVPRTGTSATADPPRKKMKRLFLWAVVKSYEEGSIVLWDGDVRPLPVPPPPVFEQGGSRDQNELWSHGDNTMSTSTDPSLSCSLSVSVLYTSSASASLYSHYHLPRQSSGSRANIECDVVDTDTDPAYLSDPPVDEEAYIPLTPRFLSVYVRDALGAIRRGRLGNGGGAGKAGRELTPEDILAYMQRTDTRWARLGVWVVEEALTLLRAG